MLRVKICAVIGVFGVITFVLNSSPVFVSKAENDEILKEIAGYKNWTKVTKAPIAGAETDIGG